MFKKEPDVKELCIMFKWCGPMHLFCTSKVVGNASEVQEDCFFPSMLHLNDIRQAVLHS